MEPNRKHWNEQQQLLQSALQSGADHPGALALFMSQHAMVHSAQMASWEGWSFEDEVWDGLSEAAARGIPRGCEHSIAWLTWHLARIEDVTMNLLVAGGAQLLHAENWLEKLQVSVCDTGNATEPGGVEALSAAVDLAALREYRMAVGRRTREIVAQLQPQDLKKKVDPARIARISAEGAVLPAASEVIDYWSKRTIAGLLLMPPTRHNFVHLNEALRVKQKGRTQ